MKNFNYLFILGAVILSLGISGYAYAREALIDDNESSTSMIEARDYLTPFITPMSEDKITLNQINIVPSESSFYSDEELQRERDAGRRPHPGRGKGQGHGRGHGGPDEDIADLPESPDQDDNSDAPTAHLKKGYAHKPGPFDDVEEPEEEPDDVTPVIAMAPPDIEVNPIFQLKKYSDGTITTEDLLSIGSPSEPKLTSLETYLDDDKSTVAIKPDTTLGKSLDSNNLIKDIMKKNTSVNAPTKNQRKHVNLKDYTAQSIKETVPAKLLKDSATEKELKDSKTKDKKSMTSKQKQTRIRALRDRKTQVREKVRQKRVAKRTAVRKARRQQVVQRVKQRVQQRRQARLQQRRQARQEAIAQRREALRRQLLLQRQQNQ